SPTGLRGPPRGASTESPWQRRVEYSRPSAGRGAGASRIRDRRPISIPPARSARGHSGGSMAAKRRSRRATKRTRRAPAATKRRPARGPAVLLLVGTRKGAFLFRSDGSRLRWKVEGPHFLGQTVHHLVLDPRDGRTMLMAAKTGHLGPTIFRSTDEGREWKEAAKPPAFRKAAEEEAGRSVAFTFLLSPGHAADPGHWYAGTSPTGLFRSSDGGATWEEVAGFNDGTYPRIQHKINEVPGGSLTHSILVDPRNRAHL